MKSNLILGAVVGISLFASSATAGSLADPVVAPDVIVEDTTSSSSGAGFVLSLATILALSVGD